MNLFEAILFLTLNVYHEARSEEQFAQVAVAHVTMNRARERHLPIKGVVLQPKQFSWTHQLKSYWPKNLAAFMNCLESVTIAAQGNDFTNGATYYHLNTIHPWWADSMHYVADFGSHKFYIEE